MQESNTQCTQTSDTILQSIVDIALRMDALGDMDLHRYLKSIFMASARQLSGISFEAMEYAHITSNMRIDNLTDFYDSPTHAAHLLFFAMRADKLQPTAEDELNSDDLCELKELCARCSMFYDKYFTSHTEELKDDCEWIVAFIEQETGKTLSSFELATTESFTRARYEMIRQGIATNGATKMLSILEKAAIIDPITKTASVEHKGVKLTLPNKEMFTKVRVSTALLLDAITLKFTESGAKSRTVCIPLSEYMERRNLTNRQEAKNQATTDIKVLSLYQLTWEEKRKGNTQNYRFINLADTGNVMQNGDIMFTFTTTFYNVLLGYPVMPYPGQMQTFNIHKNPNGFPLLRRIAEHKNMNVGKKNENIISVKTLLEAAISIPTYDEVAANDRAFTRRIIDPFERDMDAMNETLQWHYCRRYGEPLTESDLESMDYKLFATLFIKTEWLSYPDQTERLKKKEKSIKKMQKEKKRAALNEKNI